MHGRGTVTGRPLADQRPPLAAVAETVYRLLRSPRPPRLTRYAISHLAMERTLDISAAVRTLGYRPAPTSFAGAADW